MASVGADGGMVSTVDDSIRFLRAFSGAFMFWCPETRVLLAGTVDDLTRRSAPFRLMLQARAAFLHGSAT